MRRVLALLMTLSTLGACGPIVYVNEVTRKASSSVDEARAAEADRYAPYYWTRATQYLRQARVLAAHADFQGANRYGRLATEAAELAVQEAVVAAKDPSKRALEHKPKADIAPAKGEIAPAKDEP